jgi:hypothetical protein
MDILTEREFLNEANRRCRERLMGEGDHWQYLESLADAAAHAAKGRPYYRERDAGGVANAYDYSTTTAQWGVWVCPLYHTVVQVVRRPIIRGRHVPCARAGGRRQYDCDWRRIHAAGVPV